MPIYLMHNLICAITASKCIGLGFEYETHAKNIAHGFAKGSIRFKLRVGIDIGMNFEVDFKSIEGITKFVSNLN